MPGDGYFSEKAAEANKTGALARELLLAPQRKLWQKTWLAINP